MRDREKARQKAKELVAQMTLEERASQLRYDAPAIPRLGVPTYNWWNEALHGVARAGVATSFPQAIAMAAAFDEELEDEIRVTVIATGFEETAGAMPQKPFTAAGEKAAAPGGAASRAAAPEPLPEKEPQTGGPDDEDWQSIFNIFNKGR